MPSMSTRAAWRSSPASSMRTPTSPGSARAARSLRRAPCGARFAAAFWEQGDYSVEECEQFLRAAREAGLGLKLHAEQRTRSGGAKLAARMGAVSADHLEHASDDDLRALADAGTVGV